MITGRVPVLHPPNNQVSAQPQRSSLKNQVTKSHTHHTPFSLPHQEVLFVMHRILLPKFRPDGNMENEGQGPRTEDRTGSIQIQSVDNSAEYVPTDFQNKKCYVQTCRVSQSFFLYRCFDAARTKEKAMRNLFHLQPRLFFKTRLFFFAKALRRKSAHSNADDCTPYRTSAA